MIKDYNQFQERKKELRKIEKLLLELRKSKSSDIQDYIKAINKIKGEINEYLKHKT